MNGKTHLKLSGAALVLLLLLGSCTNFFSTSWGEIFKRDPKKVKVTSSNVYELLDTARGDRDLSREILNQIKPTDNTTLKHAAIKAANQAADLPSLMLENLKTLFDIIENEEKDDDTLTEIAKILDEAVGGNDIAGISDKLTEILKDDVVVVKPKDDPKGALINTEHIVVPVPANPGAGQPPATITLDINEDGTGTAIITVNGVTESYPCEINDDGTITLEGAGAGNTNVDLGYTINPDDTLTLSGLDEIAGENLANVSSPSTKPIDSKIEFEDEHFLDDVSDSDLTLMVMALILAKYEKEKEAQPDTYPDLEAYLRSWEHKNVKTGYGMDPDEELIAATVNGMIDRGELTNDTNKLTDMLKDLLEQE